MLISGFSLLRPLSSHRSFQSYVARDESGQLFRLLRVAHASRSNSEENRTIERLKRCSVISHPSLLPCRILSSTEDEIVVSTPFHHNDSLAVDASLGRHAISLIEKTCAGLAKAHLMGVAHGCLSLDHLYKAFAPASSIENVESSFEIAFDLTDLLLTPTSSANSFDCGEAFAFAEDVRQFGELLLSILHPEDSSTVTNKQIFDCVQQMTDPDWTSRPSMYEVLKLFVDIQCNAHTAFGSDRKIISSSSMLEDVTMDLSVTGETHSLSVEKETAKQIGRFEIQRRLGEGGMGAVLLGCDKTDGNLVAIKVLADQWSHHDRSMRRFEREARLLSTLTHPCIAQLIEFNRVDDRMYLVMEYVSGGTLADFTRQGKPLDERYAIRLISDAAHALEVAHSNGLIHRDIKPANLLLTEEGKSLMEGHEGHLDLAEPLLKVADFGLAKHFDSAESMAMTQSGAIVGTPLYMAPEQCRGQVIGPQIDVYALGITLFQCMAGKLPFTGEAPVDIFRQHCDAPVPKLRSLNPKASDAIQTVIEKCLAKSPLARYQTAGELAQDLDRLILGESSSIQVHPSVPDPNQRDVLRYQYQWLMKSSPELMWPYVSNTDRVNHSIGLPAVQYQTIQDPILGMRRMATVRVMGMNMQWEEHAYEWIEGRRLSVLREFPTGPFYWFTNVVELHRQTSGGTLITQTLSMRPRNLLGKIFAKFQIGAKSERNFGRVYEQIDSYLLSNSKQNFASNPYAKSQDLSRAQKKRLSERMERVRSEGASIPPAILDAIEQYIEYASDLDVARIRPIAFADRFRFDPNQTVHAFLLCAREGIVVLLWDLLCPTCRIPSDVKETLKGLSDHGHCEACGIDYELDFARNIEVIFRTHPEVRISETKTYCIGGPAFSSHVVAQIILRPEERLCESFNLVEGQYRLRGPQLPFVIDFRVSAGSQIKSWDIHLDTPPLKSKPIVLKNGEQFLRFFNPHSTPRNIRIERIASKADALTAADAARVQVFREWFPEEVLSPGQMISVTNVTLMACRIANVAQIFSQNTEQAACAHILKHLHNMSQIITRHSGCVFKTQNDGLFAVFSNVTSSVTAAKELVEHSESWNIHLQFAIHQGPAVVATVNDRLDYFGKTTQYVFDLLSHTSHHEIRISDVSWNESELDGLFGNDWAIHMNPPIADWPQWSVVTVSKSDLRDTQES